MSAGMLATHMTGVSGSPDYHERSSTCCQGLLQRAVVSAYDMLLPRLCMHVQSLAWTSHHNSHTLRAAAASSSASSAPTSSCSARRPSKSRIFSASCRRSMSSAPCRLASLAASRSRSLCRVGASNFLVLVSVGVMMLRLHAEAARHRPSPSQHQ
jgi:hypothetical protein